MFTVIPRICIIGLLADAFFQLTTKMSLQQMSIGLATAMSAESVRVTTVYKQEVTYTAAW